MDIPVHITDRNTNIGNEDPQDILQYPQDPQDPQDDISDRNTIILTEDPYVCISI